MRYILALGLVFVSMGSAYGIEEIEMTLPGGERMSFVWIEPGTFVMGSAETDKTQLGAELPQHEVMIKQGFWLGKYEITQRQWESVMGDNPSRYESPNRPVETVTWYQVQEFIHKLNQAAADSLYRLPSEAEWEYACRAGTETPWFFGEDENALGDYAWYADNNRTDGDYPVGTKPVGLKPPNPWGLFDMYGNAYEWCQNGYAPYTDAAQIDPMEPDTGYGYTFRGGHFYGNTRAVRSAVRGYNLPSSREIWLGARLLMIEPVATSKAPDSWGRIKIGAR